MKHESATLMPRVNRCPVHQQMETQPVTVDDEDEDAQAHCALGVTRQCNFCQCVE